LWNNGTPKVLPPNVFLICGDRAWQGIPKNAYGGPCYLGKLTLFTPRMSSLRNITRVRRSLGLTPDCRDDVELLYVAARTALAIFLPGGAAGAALNQLEKLACWAEKQANVTTEILEQLLVDQNSLRHALLQNRAAIDFLLLAQGHGCEDFEGMCCFNLSDHSEPIHKQLKWLREHTQKITVDHNPFDDWLRSIFRNISPWLLSFIKETLRILGLLLLIVIIARIAYS
ncbi:ENV1 protein, partial [Ramphastos sulfuratus]|nr:ENV1 protein [Ramphastos sulfuratus]